MEEHAQGQEKKEDIKKDDTNRKDVDTNVKEKDNNKKSEAKKAPKEEKKTVSPPVKKGCSEAQSQAANVKPKVQSTGGDTHSLKKLDEQLEQKISALKNSDGDSYREKLRYEACIFDLDGVITESAVVHKAAWKKLFDSFLKEKGDNNEFNDEDYRKYVDGLPRYDGVKKVLRVQKYITSSRKKKRRAITQNDMRIGKPERRLLLGSVREGRSEGIRWFCSSTEGLESQGC